MNIFKRIKWFFLCKTMPLDKLAKKCGVNIGENNYVNSIFWSTEPYLITIGDNCQITNDVKLLTHGGANVLRQNDREFDTFGKIKIGNWVYIGSRALIMPGVEIGDNVLIAAGSVVTKSLPSGIVVAGNPAKYICTIEEYKSRNERYNTKSKSLSNEKKKELLLSLSDESFIHKKYITKSE